MAKVTQYTCDFPGCTAVRTESNHWFLVTVDKLGETPDSCILIHPFSEDIYNTIYTRLTMCSEAHVIQYISSALSKLFPLRVEEDTYNQNDVPLKYPEVPQNRP